MKKNAAMVKPTEPETMIGWTQKDAMEYLRNRHPEFFEDANMRALAIVVVMELSEELKKLRPVQRTSVIAVIIRLMYNMGESAVKSIRENDDDGKARTMGQIFVEDYHKKHAADSDRGVDCDDPTAFNG